MQEGTQNMVFDDFDVEIVDLDPIEYEKHHRKRVRRRFTKRQRRLGTVVTTIVYVLTLGLLVSTLPGIGAQVWHRLFPAQTGVLHTVPFYLVGNPSWGHFAIDGKSVEALPAFVQNRPLALPPGTHTIDWQAAPFQAQSCTLQLTSTRALATGPSCIIRSIFPAGKSTRTLVVCFFASLSDLSPAQQAHVLQQTQVTLTEQTEQTIVQPGEWYALSPQEPGVSPTACHSTRVGTLCATQATRPLQATLHLQVEDRSQFIGQCRRPLLLCQLVRQDCRSFCENPNMPLQAQGWNIQALVRGYWTYTPMTGQVPGKMQPLSFASVATSQSISLYLTWDQHRWQATLLDAPGMIDSPERNPICLQAQQDLQRISSLSNQRTRPIQIIGDSASSPADGCLVALQPATTRSGNAPPAIAYCFERFGVLLAVNDMARRLWPYLPVINAQEQLLVESFEPAALDGPSGLG
jgi:hypothetical protein